MIEWHDHHEATERAHNVLRRCTGLCVALLLAACTTDEALDESAELRVAPTQSIGIVGAGYQAVNAIAAAPGRILVAGAFTSPLTYEQVELQPASGADAYVASFEPSGRLVYALPVAGQGDDRLLDVALLSDGSSVIGGQVTAGAQIGGDSQIGSDQWAALVAVLSDGGDVEWSRTSSGAGLHSVRSVAATANGTVYVVGDYSGAMSFGGIELPFAEDADCFVAAFRREGDLLWIRALGGPDAQSVEQMQANEDGSVTLIGNFTQALHVAEGDERAAVPGFERTPFVAQFDAEGVLRWVQTELLSRPSQPAETHEHEHEHEHEHGTGSHSDHGAGLEAYGWASLFAGGAADTHVAVAYGSAFSLHGGVEVEVPAIARLNVVRLGASGEVLTREVTSGGERPLRIVSGALTRPGSTLTVSASWEGTLEIDGHTLASRTRSLVFADLSPNGHVSEPRQFAIDGLALSHRDAAASPGALWIAAQTYDAVRDDHDVLLLRFDQEQSATR